ncbi:MAG TPA: hypothetical protein PLU20_09155 [Ornithinibacter sp.]|nr:hypothetical protein [Ornithinibacter sp.]HQD69522.1 hypothetical protein [Ornithinibacter sp.]HQG17651.1 hypothetical protein [Ornithinibacter sp.]
MSTGGMSGSDWNAIVKGGDPPSVTQSAPWLAGIRLTLAQVPVRQVLGAAAVLVWAVWLIAMWVTQPRIVPPSQLEADLAQGQVTSFGVVRLVETDGGFFISGGRTSVEPAGDGRDALGETVDEWPSSDGRLTVAYWVDSPVADLRVIDPDRAAPPELEAIADRLGAAAVEDRTRSLTYSTFSDGVSKADVAISLVALLVVVMGPRPGRGTRWFWFWLIWLPFGLGLLAFAVFEVLRPPRLVLVPESAGSGALSDEGDPTASDDDPASAHPVSPRRYSGWAGLGLSILGGILIGTIADQLAQTLPLVFVRY